MDLYAKDYLDTFHVAIEPSSYAVPSVVEFTLWFL